MDLIEKKSLFFGKMIGSGLPNPSIRWSMDVIVWVILYDGDKFVKPWYRPHLSLEDLYSLRNVNEYFNSQIDQYLKYRFIATYELEDPFLFLLTWIDTTNEETVQNWHILTPFDSFGVKFGVLLIFWSWNSKHEMRLKVNHFKESYDEESINSFICGRSISSGI